MECVEHLLSERWDIMVSSYDSENFVSAVRRGGILAVQFHPEKSGMLGLELLRRFALKEDTQLDSMWEWCKRNTTTPVIKNHIQLNNNENNNPHHNKKRELAKRIIACLDVRTVDDGTITVTKGNQYNVREEDGKVRDLGSPVLLAEKYYNEGADEIVFLSIKSYNKDVLSHTSMIETIKQSASRVFVPLCVGGGVRNLIRTNEETQETVCTPAVDIAAAYFQAGADKVSIGSDAVKSVLHYIEMKKVKDGTYLDKKRIFVLLNL